MFPKEFYGYGLRTTVSQCDWVFEIHYQGYSYLKVSKKEWNTLPQDPYIIYVEWDQRMKFFAKYLKLAVF